MKQLSPVSHGEIHALRAAVENVKTIVIDVNLRVESIDTKSGDRPNRVRRQDGLLRGLQSKVDQYAEEAQRFRKAFVGDLERQAKAQHDQNALLFKHVKTFINGVVKNTAETMAKHTEETSVGIT